MHVDVHSTHDDKTTISLSKCLDVLIFGYFSARMSVFKSIMLKLKFFFFFNRRSTDSFWQEVSSDLKN